MKRLYDQVIYSHFDDDDLMLFLSGPRQVGKTTTSKECAHEMSEHVVYLNWDNDDHRELILKGSKALMELVGIDEIREQKPILILDEIHKYENWKNFLKGIFNRHSPREDFSSGIANVC